MTISFCPVCKGDQHDPGCQKVREDWISWPLKQGAREVAQYVFLTSPRRTPPLVEEMIRAPVAGLRALDLGACPGSASEFLLERGWSVIAIDRHREAVDQWLHRCGHFKWPWLDRLAVQIGQIGEYSFESRVELVVAHDVLPFCDPRLLSSLLNKIFSALEGGGIFIGSCFLKGGEVEPYRQLWGAWFAPSQNWVVKRLHAAGFSRVAIREKGGRGLCSHLVEFICFKHSPSL